MPRIRQHGWLSCAGQGLDAVEHGVECGFERSGVPFELGHQQPALQRGQGRQGQLLRVGAGRQVAAGVHDLEAVTDAGLPAT